MTKNRMFSLILCALLLLGGQPVLAAEAAAEETVAEEQTVIIPDTSEMFSDRDRDGDYEDYVTVTLADGKSKADGAGVTVDEDVITVTAEGTYLFTGALSDGQIAVEAGDGDKVQIVLAGAEITRAGSAALYIREADKVFLSLAPDTENVLASTGEFVQTDNNTVDGAVFSKCDLTINGAGRLTVCSDTGHGIVGKDDLKITGGICVVQASGKGLEANDSVRMAGGDVTIISGADGVQVENTEDLSRGYVYILDGRLTVECGGDGVSATGALMIDGGSLELATGNETTADDASAKGLKSDSVILIQGGSMLIRSVDDAVHTNGNVEISGGELTLYSGDDAVHADDTVTISGGSVSAPYCYEGLEGTNVNISGGYVSVVSTDDGLNAGGGADGSGFGGRGGMGSFELIGSAAITISGGEVHVNAEGDGLDANGTLSVSGGAVYVAGPSSSFNGTLDFDREAVITGGLVMTTGPASWLQNFGQNSTQGSILVSFASQKTAGTEITLTDNATGEVICSCTAEKNFQSSLISAPGIVVGGSYTVTAGDESQTVEMTSLLYSAGGMGGMGGGRGGKGTRGGW